MLRYRSPWWVYSAGLAMLIGLCLAVGVLQGHPVLVQGVLVALPVLGAVVLRASGPVASLRWSDATGCELSGGVAGRTVRLGDFEWLRCYRAGPRTFYQRGGMLIVLCARAGRHPFGKMINEWAPTVTPRRTTLIIATGWRDADGTRLTNLHLEALVRRACRAEGFVVEEHPDSFLRTPRWTASRPRAPAP